MITFLLTLLIASGLHTPVGAEPRIVFTQVNGERLREGVPALSFDECLTALANARAQDMVARNYFGHVTPDGRNPSELMRAAGCPFRYMGENIATAPDAMYAVTELWNSPGHRRNTLNVHYRRIGIGLAVRADGTEFYVEEFSD